MSGSRFRWGPLACALGVALTVGGCTSGSTKPSASTTQARSTPDPTYAVDLRTELAKLVHELLVPGAAVVVRSSELGDWSTTFGTRARGGRERVALGDHVRIGSNTKTMTGTVILQLVGERKLSLDDPIARFRPEVPNGANITITELLDMRSGLYNYSESLELNQALDTTPQRVFAPDELLAMAYKHPPYFAPGAGYHYSNTNTVLLGLVIEQLTGNRVEDEFRKRIFNPLGLKDTTFPARTSNAILDPHPNGYMFGSNVETLATQTLPPEQQARARAGTLQPADVTNDNPSWGWTAGAGISNAPDLARYVQALVGGGLLDAPLQAQRLASMQPTEPSNPASASYGLGLAKLGPMYGHTGELPGYNSFMGYDPARKITLVVWTSLSAAPDGQPPAIALARAVLARLYGANPATPSPSGATP
jgi:D-alanyl-D-alanine carboxypeptidase